MTIGRLATLLCAALAAVGPAVAQTTPPAGPAAPPGLTRTPILANERVRVQSVVLEAGATLPQHTHAQDHFTVSLGGTDLVEVAEDGTERRRTPADGVLGLVPAGSGHSLRNAGGAAFRAVAVDLLAPQTGARNRCAALLAGQPLDCPARTASDGKKNGVLVPQMETDQTVVSLLTLDPGAERHFKASAAPPLVVALEGTDARALIELQLSGAVGKGEKPLKGGDATTTLPKSPLTIRNTGAGPARFVVFEFRR